MASSSPSPLSLGWCSIIETLADLKQAELPLLKGLINRVPDFYTAAPEWTRERVALRYLEECASSGIVNTKGLSEGTVGISQYTEQFLCQNLTRPIAPSASSQNRVGLISNDIRQFISQKRSALPNSSVELLKESVSGADTKLPLTTEDVSSLRLRQGDNIVDEGHEISHYQEDNIVVEEDEMISNPRSAGCAESSHTDTSDNLPSQSALDADKTGSEHLQENMPITIENASNLEAARTEDSSDNMAQFILKRRAVVQKNTSVEELNKHTPEICIPAEPSRNDNSKKLRHSADLLDHPSDSESYFMESPIPFLEQNQCIICNKEGQLLTCSRKGCGMTVHESCIMVTPNSFNKEGWFYCPCCACARAAHEFVRAKKALPLAKESLSSLKAEKDQNQEGGEKGKQPVGNNVNDKRKGEKGEFSDNTTEDEDGDDTLLDASWSSELASRDSRKKVKNDGKTKKKQIKFNGRNTSEERDMLHGRVKEAKRHKADLAFAPLDKYIYVKSGPGATSGNHKVASMKMKRRQAMR